jgi:hypothetical protein
MALMPSPACRREPVFNKILETILHLRKDLPRLKDFPSNVFFFNKVSIRSTPHSRRAKLNGKFKHPYTVYTYNIINDHVFMFQLQ